MFSGSRVVLCESTEGNDETNSCSCVNSFALYRTGIYTCSHATYSLRLWSSDCPSTEEFSLGWLRLQVKWPEAFVTQTVDGYSDSLSGEVISSSSQPPPGTLVYAAPTSPPFAEQDSSSIIFDAGEIKTRLKPVLLGALHFISGFVISVLS